MSGKKKSAPSTSARVSNNLHRRTVACAPGDRSRKKTCRRRHIHIWDAIAPRSRIDLWDAIRTLVNQGTNVLLTTQYLDEADHLADQIVIIDHGENIARGTPA